MSDKISKITVRIGGMNYQLLSAENETYMRKIAAHADQLIVKVRQNNPRLSLGMATVLALVNAVDELFSNYKSKEETAARDIQAQQQVSELEKELLNSREQVWEMKKELLSLQKLCAEYEELLETETQGDDHNSANILETKKAEEITEYKQATIDDYLS